MVDNLKDLEIDTNHMCKNRQKISKENKSEPLGLEDLKIVSKELG